MDSTIDAKYIAVSKAMKEACCIKKFEELDMVPNAIDTVKESRSHVIIIELLCRQRNRDRIRDQNIFYEGIT